MSGAAWREELYKRGNQKNKGQFTAKGGGAKSPGRAPEEAASGTPNKPLTAGQKAAATRAARAAAQKAASEGKAPDLIREAARKAAASAAGKKAAATRAAKRGGTQPPPAPPKAAGGDGTKLTAGQKAAATRAARKAAEKAAAAGKSPEQVKQAAAHAATTAVDHDAKANEHLDAANAHRDAEAKATDKATAMAHRLAIEEHSRATNAHDAAAAQAAGADDAKNAELQSSVAWFASARANQIGGKEVVKTTHGFDPTLKLRPGLYAGMNAAMSKRPDDSLLQAWRQPSVFGPYGEGELRDHPALSRQEAILMHPREFEAKYGIHVVTDTTPSGAEGGTDVEKLTAEASILPIMRQAISGLDRRHREVLRRNGVSARAQAVTGASTTHGPGRSLGVYYSNERIVHTAAGYRWGDGKEVLYSKWPEKTVVHELGHALDAALVGSRGSTAEWQSQNGAFTAAAQRAIDALPADKRDRSKYFHTPWETWAELYAVQHSRASGPDDASFFHSMTQSEARAAFAEPIKVMNSLIEGRIKDMGIK